MKKRLLSVLLAWSVLMGALPVYALEDTSTAVPAASAQEMATVETAKESERGIVDMDTLKATNESLISTLDEVMNIQKEGRQKRAEAEAELQNMENELKKKLLQIQG